MYGILGTVIYTFKLSDFKVTKKTKQLIVDLTRHMESIEQSYNRVNKEIEKRVKK